MNADSPAALVLARAAACRRGDFAFVYDSYLADSNFRAQFPVRADYLAFAAEQLVGVIVLHECRVLRERVDGDAATVIFYQRIEAHGTMAETLELAHLRRTSGSWGYAGSERLERAAVARALEDVDEDDFTRVPERLVL